MRIRTFILLQLIFTSNIIYAQKNESSNDLVVKFLNTVEENAYMSPSINWDSIRPAVINKTKNITDPHNLKPYFEAVIKLLNDGHSSIIYNQNQQQGKSDELAFYKTLAMVTDADEGLPPKKFEHYLLYDKYAYIYIPSVILELRKYVDTIGYQITELDKKNPQAWIIDLTGNEGGNKMVMIWQFASLITSKKSYSLVDNKGKAVKEPTRFNTYKSKQEESIAKILNLEYNKVLPIEIKNKNIPIIILISNKTSSAGEFFAAYFKGQSNVKLIGNTTNGQTTNNKPFEIGDNYTINLSTRVLKDRTGRVYKVGEGIQPDIFVELPANENEVKQKYLDAAVKYLEKK